MSFPDRMGLICPEDVLSETCGLSICSVAHSSLDSVHSEIPLGTVNVGWCDLTLMYLELAGSSGLFGYLSLQFDIHLSLPLTWMDLGVPTL